MKEKNSEKVSIQQTLPNLGYHFILYLGLKGKMDPDSPLQECRLVKNERILIGECL